jgi:hypothetical protein
MNYKEIIKELIIKDLIKTYGEIPGIENLIVVKENKDITKGQYSVSLHALANFLKREN